MLLLLNQCLDPKMSHIISCSYSLVYMGTNLLLEMLGEISLFFFFLDQNKTKEQKEDFWGTLKGSWKRPERSADVREALGSSMLDVGRFLPHPSLISLSLHLLSGCHSPSVSPSGSTALLAATPTPSAASLAPSATAVAVSPLQYLVLHFLNCDIQLGLWKSQEKSCGEPGCLLLLITVTLHQPHYSLAGASLCPSGRQRSLFPLIEKHRQYPDLKGLFCCLCPLLPWTLFIARDVLA